MNTRNARQRVAMRPVLAVAIPVLVESCLRILLGNVDQWMLSDFSDTAVAAVGNANQVMNMGIMVLEMVCSATTIILSQYIGANREKDVSKLYTLSLGMILILSVLLSLVLVGLRRQIFIWMNIPQELTNDASLYLAIVGGTLVFQGVFMGASAILRSHILMREIMIGSIGMNVVNVILNFVLINGYGPFPRLGVWGAAVSTAVSRAVGAVFLMAFMLRRLDIHLELSALIKPDLRLVGRIFRVGLPAAGDSISYTCMQMVLLSLINTFGTVAVTARVYVGSVLPFVYIFASSLATATQVKVGHLVGGRQPDMAMRLVQKSTKISMCVSFGLSLLLLAGCREVFGLFTRDELVLDMIRSILMVDVFLELGRAVNLTMIRALLSAGDTSYPMYCAFSSMWGVGVFLSFVLGKWLGLGVVGIWIGMAADEWCRGIAFLIRWKSGKWIEKRLL